MDDLKSINENVIDIKELTNTNCKYCTKMILTYMMDWFQCNICEEKIHRSCLKRLSTPGGFHGDIFFTFTCIFCSTTESEVLQRDKMPWFTIVVLVMHHLHYKSLGTAKNGYFHWRIHVVKFIEKNWDTLFIKNFKKRKNWFGTIAGILSTYSPYFFMSGIKEIGESGWWKLTSSKLYPGFVVTLNSDLVKEKQKKTFVDELQFLKQQIQKYVLTSTEIYNDVVVPLHSNFDLTCKNLKKYKRKLEDDPSSDRSENIPFFKNHGLNFSEIVQQMDFGHDLKNIKNESTNLFSKCTSSNISDIWKQKLVLPVKTNKSVIPLDVEEEQILTRYLTKFNTPEGKILRRKLIVRELQRKAHLKPFDISDELKSPETKLLSPKSELISCYGQGRKSSQSNAILLRIVSENGLIAGTERISPFTGRHLKPFIRRDETMVPPWLKLMMELKYCVGKQPVSRLPVDFCYVAANHIPVINSLCEHFFWPGIDLTECLQYPDFSIVALYGKLIVGFAFLVPDTKHNEAYVSFILVLPAWRRAGLASFMLYHLIHTCMGKDVTLHVAVDNPALLLYQHFGFKTEQLQLNFYQSYLAHDDTTSRHAFFMRLER